MQYYTHDIQKYDHIHAPEKWADKNPRKKRLQEKMENTRQYKSINITRGVNTHMYMYIWICEYVYL